MHIVDRCWLIFSLPRDVCMYVYIYICIYKKVVCISIYIYIMHVLGSKL